MIRYSSDPTALTREQMEGFFVGWPNPPRPETLLRLFMGSYRVMFALDGEQVVGFVTAISDGVLSAYVPLLEVLPSHQGRGIGTELTRRMLDDLSSLYMVDVMCDEEVVPFYEHLGLRRATGVIRRTYSRQSGE